MITIFFSKEQKRINRSNVANYIPVPIPKSIVLKVLEKLINISCVFSKEQYGFKNWLSTADAILELIFKSNYNFDRSRPRPCAN